ncbi:MAG TPA: hypothetical protein VGM10_35710 [Actinocrinis sp.]|jgi:hypothetical protein
MIISRLIPARWCGGWRCAVIRGAVNAAALIVVFCALRAIGADPWSALAICFVPSRGRGGYR